MTLFMFIIGLISIVVGLLLRSYDEDIAICIKHHKLVFRQENLGTGVLVFGSALLITGVLMEMIMETVSLILH